MNGPEDQLFPMAELILCVIAGFAGFALGYAHKLRSNPDAFMTVLFFATFLCVFSIALGGFGTALLSAVVGAGLALTRVLIEWLMPLPERPPSDEDDAD